LELSPRANSNQSIWDLTSTTTVEFSILLRTMKSEPFSRYTSKIRQVFHIPTFLTIVCEQLPETIPKSIVGLPCHFTLDQNEIPLIGQFYCGPPAQIGSLCSLWILLNFTTGKATLESFIRQRVRKVGWLGSR